MQDLEIRILMLLTTDIDDQSPQELAAAQADALSAGALDCVIIPTHMKKGRHGLRMEILCEPHQRDTFTKFLLENTTSLGVRVTEVQRFALRREFRTIEVRGQSIRIKIALADGRVLRAVPEFDDIRAAGVAAGLPVHLIGEVIRAAALAAFPRGSTLPEEG